MLHLQLLVPLSKKLRRSFVEKHRYRPNYVALCDWNDYYENEAMMQHILRITVVSGRLLKTDSNEVYVELRVGEEETRTRIIEGTINPNWKETFFFYVANPREKKISLTVYDRKSSDSRFLGDLELQLADYYLTSTDQMFLLANTNQGAALHLQIQYWF
jgi:Ca2+-dependent lipid-binding protein